MKLQRREFLRTAGLASMAGIVPGLLSCDNSNTGSKDNEAVETENIRSFAPATTEAKNESWEEIRKQFVLDPSYVHMSGLLLASHPKPVQDAIKEYRRKLNDNPAMYVEEQFSDLPDKVRQRAGTYMNVHPLEIAITDSTTMGTSLLINGLHIRPDQEMLAAELDYPATHEAMEFKSQRSGASLRKFKAYADIHNVSEDEIVENYTNAIKPETRLVTATWVHSSTGLKMPIKKIADSIGQINADRGPRDRVIFFVDGVHGMGVEDTDISDLGCDFFSAGTHKWMFGPRGTGILWGHSRSHDQVTPTIPSFTNNAGWGGRMSPGGFQAFEHKWAMAEAFQFHLDIGKERVRERIHTFNQDLKEGLNEMRHVRLYSPMDKNLTSGMVCFDVEGMNRVEAVRRLRARNIVASFTPYARSYARLAPGLFNTSKEIENTLKAVRDLA